jgi:membrane-bound serine protease (ClpP class)
MSMPYQISVIVKKAWKYALLAILAPGLAAGIQEQGRDLEADDTLDSPARLAILVDVQGPIGPATADFLVDSLEKAASRSAEVMIVRLDTPGGLDASTRDIIKAILNSSVPVATFVAPEGARAASAGTYILYASHIAAMSPATNAGAATPVDIIGGKKPGQVEEPRPKETGGESPDDGNVDAEDPKSIPLIEPTDAMGRKVVNDAVAYIRGLADKRGRNADWAELAVRKADSITASKALEIGVIDLIARDNVDLLDQIHGRKVDVQGRERVMDTKSAQIERLEPGWKTELLAVITSPTIAYLLLLVGVYGLILEGYNPGAILPGVVGAISLLVALYAFQMLPVNYAGFGLIVLGIILMIAEVMAPSFGALGIGGVIAMVIGSIILIDTDVPGFIVSRPLIGAIALVSSLGLMAIIGFAVKARRRPVVAGREELVGAVGTAMSDFAGQGSVFVHSERWSSVSSAPLRKGQKVVVTEVDGLTLKVSPLKE